MAATEPKSPSLSSRLARRRPMHRIAATVKRAPTSIPGKKPASIAEAGNLFSCAVAVASDEAAADVALAALLLVELGLLVEEAEAGLDVEAGAFVLEAGLADDEADTCITHRPWLQMNPFGQHVLLLPHVERVPVSSILCSWFCGWSVAFCALKSQVSGDIELQSRPFGQQMADLLSLKAVHVESDGQQKLDGRPGLLQGE